MTRLVRFILFLSPLLTAGACPRSANDLAPNSAATGVLGYPCNEDGSCAEGLACLETGDVRICVSSEPDCNGVWGGAAALDNCNTCDEDPTNDCVQDCNGVWGGAAALDNCNTCDEDPTNDCVQDCNGEWGGPAAADNCGHCDAVPANDCTQDCLGVWGGLATEDNCGFCDAISSNDCVQDCAGVWGGLAQSDRCGVCDDDPNNDCSQDCLGVWGGENYLDACRVCDDDPTNDCEAACQLASGPDAGVSSTDGGVASCTAAEEANCGPGTLASHGICVPEDETVYSLPFPPVARADGGLPDPLEISQGFAGYYSHNGRQRYAVDFNVPIGTPIAAARAGYVFAVKEDSSSNCPSVSCSADSNYLRIMHGDGTETLYLHLNTDGVFVEEGDFVCEGDIVAESGNTGWTTGPHLHFAVLDAYGDTLPVRFAEMLDVSDGLPIPGYAYESHNHPDEGCSEVPLSGCPTDFYLHRGLLLEPGFPCISDDASDTVLFAGTNVSGSPQTYVRLTRSNGAVYYESWDHCLENGSDGSFSLEINWSDLGAPGDIIYVFATAAEWQDTDDGTVCGTFYGWERSFSVQLK